MGAGSGRSGAGMLCVAALVTGMSVGGCIAGATMPLCMKWKTSKRQRDLRDLRETVCLLFKNQD